MKAKLLPLEGKYYGTTIEIEDDNGDEFDIKLWGCYSGEPSDRELGAACTIEQWRNNEILPIKNDWTGELGIPAKEYCEICDTHYESRETYALASKIVELLNAN